MSGYTCGHCGEPEPSGVDEMDVVPCPKCGHKDWRKEVPLELVPEDELGDA